MAAAGTHTSSWRSLVSIAPLLGVGAIAFAVAQGEPEFARAPEVYGILIVVSVAGWLVARQLTRMFALRIVVPLATAKEGDIALRGSVQPLPGAALLRSPGGTECLWYRRVRKGLRAEDYSATDSVRPFLLADESGACVVLPAGADIAAAHRVGLAGGYELLMLPGDPAYVAGRFEPVSERSLERIARAFDASPAPAPPALPVVRAPAFGPYVITSKEVSGESWWYLLLARINLGLVLLASAVFAFLLLAAPA